MRSNCLQMSNRATESLSESNNVMMTMYNNNNDVMYSPKKHNYSEVVDAIEGISPRSNMAMNLINIKRCVALQVELHNNRSRSLVPSVNERRCFFRRESDAWPRVHTSMCF